MTKLLITAILSLSLFASQVNAGQFSKFHGKTVVVDRITATFKVEGKNHIIVLSVKQGRKRSKRIAQALRAATAITGCTATQVRGTIFDFQGKGEKPVYVPVSLKC